MADAPETRGPEDKNMDALQSMLGPAAMMFRPMIELAIGNSLRAYAGGMPYGSNGLFGPQNVGGNLIDYFTQRTMQVTMQGTQQSLEASRQEFRVAMQQTVGLPKEQAQIAAARFNLTNLGADVLFGQLQPGFMQAGLQQALGLAGVQAPFGLSGKALSNQLQINQLGRDLSTRLMQDYLQNSQNYLGMTGQDVGQLVAESARLGHLRLRPGQTAEALAPGVISRVQGMAQAVAAGRSLFGGSALDVLDQMNALTGMNVVNSLGAEDATRVLTRMSAAMRVNLLEPGQMLKLAEGSAAVSRALGQDSFGALGAAPTIARYYTGAVQANQPFVNEARMRETLIQRVTGAQESDMARAISGAATAIAPEQREAFIRDVQAAGQRGRLTLDQVAAVAHQYGGRGSGHDFWMRGYTTEGERFRATGAATGAVMSANLGMMADIRRRQVAGFLGIDVGRLGDATTLDEMQRRAPGLLTADRMGALTRMLNREAQAFGYSSMRELDSAMIGQRDTMQQEELIRQQSGIEAGMIRLGRTRGVLGLFSFVKQAQAPGAQQATLQGALESFMGKDMNLKWADVARAAGGGKDAGALAQWVNEGAADKQLYLGLDVLMNALYTGTIGNRNLTADEYTEYRKMLAAGPTSASRDRIRGLSKDASKEQQRQMRLLELQEEIEKKRGGKSTQTPAEKEKAAQEVTREAGFRLGLEELTDPEAKKVAQEYQAAVKAQPGLTTEEWSKDNEERTGKISRLRTAMQLQSVMDMGASLGTEAKGLEGPVGMLLKLFSSVVDMGSGSIKVLDRKGA